MGNLTLIQNIADFTSDKTLCVAFMALYELQYVSRQGYRNLLGLGL